MALSEFEIIERFFAHLTPSRSDVLLGVGDDCAVLQPPPGQQLAVSIDTLVVGRHFAPDVDAESLGHKALAVNLSDLAAIGAEPAWATLALTLPAADAEWLGAFARGFAALAREHDVALVGGDTTRGPLSITVQAHGFLQPGRALRRDGMRAGDLIYVTGSLGDAGLALLARQGLFVGHGALAELNRRLDRPTPRLAAGRALRGLASAAIDVSDGLVADLGHLCAASGHGARLYLEQLPCSPVVRDYIADTGDWSLPLSAGDDYELCFAVPPQRQGEVESLAQQCAGGWHWVGIAEREPGLRCVLPDGSELSSMRGGYDHFRHD